MDLFKVRTLIDRVLEEVRNTGLDHYLGTDNDSLTHYPDFEVGIVKNISGAPLSKNQKEALKGLLDLQKDNTDETSVDYAESILNAKKRKDSRAVDWVPGLLTKRSGSSVRRDTYLRISRIRYCPWTFKDRFSCTLIKYFGIWQLLTKYAKNFFVCAIYFFPLAIFEQYIFINILKNSTKNISIFPKKYI